MLDVWEIVARSSVLDKSVGGDATPSKLTIDADAKLAPLMAMIKLIASEPITVAEDIAGMGLRMPTGTEDDRDGLALLIAPMVAVPVPIGAV